MVFWAPFWRTTMDTNPEFIIVGRMIEPVQASILHLPVFEPMSLHMFLRSIREQWQAENKSVNLVLFADRFLKARNSQLKILNKAVTLSGFKVVGVMGDMEQDWAEALNVPIVSGKPRVMLDFKEVKKRQAFLNEVYPQVNVDGLREIVEDCLRKVDDVAERKPETVNFAGIGAYLAQQARAREEAEQERLAETRLVEQAKQERLAEEARLVEQAEQERLAEEARLAELAEQERLAEEARLAELVEQERLAEEARLAELVEQERLAEEARLAELVEQERLAEEARLAEQARLAEEARLAELAEVVNEERQLLESPLRIDGRVRSGQSIHHRGDVIVEYAVHPGGEIVAAGDIHVYGTAGGRLVAGSDGDGRARIYVQRFDAEMVSIAGRYHLFEEIDAQWTGRAVKISLREGQLHFEDLVAQPKSQAA